MPLIQLYVCSLAMKIGGGTAYAKEQLLKDFKRFLCCTSYGTKYRCFSIWLGKALTNQPIL